MFSFLTGVIIGLLVGWNLPQPAWAKALQEKVFNSVKQ